MRNKKDEYMGRKSPVLPKCLTASVQRYDDTQRGLEENFAISLFFPPCFSLREGGDWEEIRGRK